MVPLNPNVVKAEYAVRGELAQRAEQLATLLATPTHSLPFTRIISCNIGNPQQLGQPPLSFFRRVLSAVECAEIRENGVKKLGWKEDVVERARELVKMVGSTGAYSHSKGVRGIREQVAEFLTRRDGVLTDPEQIYLTNGASEGISRVLQLFASATEGVGVLIPIPQYPLYAAAVTLMNAKVVPYYLDEEQQWTLTVEQLETAMAACDPQVNPKILCVINPGNPTGNCLSATDIFGALQFAKRHNLVVLFDEVYQENWYQAGTLFTSARRVKHQHEDLKSVNLFSFHSCSKGLLGECGKRGAFFHYDGGDAQIEQQLYKLASISLCPNIQGQLLVSLMVKPPLEGDPSFAEYHKETTAIYESLKRRAERLCTAFNAMHGVHCQPAMGAMYLFPRFTFTESAKRAAAMEGRPVDTFYALRLLDATGVCMVPGSGFGQAEGTFHVRCTFLAEEEEFDEFIGRVQAFHAEFVKEFG